MNREVLHYSDADKRPFLEWFSHLDRPVQAVVDRYIVRVSQGGSRNNVTPIRDGNGLKEIRVAKLGIRVYFADVTRGMLILTGGSKDTQRQDIETAKRYLRKYRDSQG